MHFGHWIGWYEHFTEFGAGDVRTLVVILSKKVFLYTLENHNEFDPRKRRIRSGITTLHGPKTVLLPEDIHFIEIALISGETTLFEHDFVLASDPDGTLRLA